MEYIVPARPTFRRSFRAAKDLKRLFLTHLAALSQLLSTPITLVDAKIHSDKCHRGFPLDE